MRLYHALIATTVALLAACTSGLEAAGTKNGFCAKPRIRITDVDVGAAIEANEDEAALKLVAIAAIPGGGSRVAFQSGNNIIVRELDA
ncbi:hypothetical protein PC119_g26041, partial [Phytophthora cactorum]